MPYIGKSPSFGVRQRYYFTAAGGETSLSGADDNSKTLIFSDGEYIDVYLNGVLLVAGTDYVTTTANTISSLAALAASDIVEVVVYDVFSVADTVSASAGGTFSGAVTVAGAFTSLGIDDNAASTTMTLDGSGNVGIANTAPGNYYSQARDLVVGTTGSTGITIASGTTGQGSVFFADGTTGSDEIRGQIRYNHVSDYMMFATNAAEAARIDSSGNLLAGTTSTTASTTGFKYRNDLDRLIVVADGGIPAQFGRLSTDGDVLLIQKDGTTIGSLGARSSADAYISLGSAGLTGSTTGSGSLFPTTGGSTYVDNVVDLGFSSGRFDNIYATNGTIITSDANEKQQIASLTDAEITAAKAISALFKTYKWNSAVEKKGDAARIHTGVIAQDVQQAMTDAGLDAGDYAFFISSTWWETQTEVPAVEADEENGIEAADAYTRIDDYETAEEAPEGAVERTRLGVRYPELLAFIGAATEQRLANIESRLAALENA